MAYTLPFVVWPLTPLSSLLFFTPLFYFQMLLFIKDVPVALITIFICNCLLSQNPLTKNSGIYHK